MGLASAPPMISSSFFDQEADSGEIVRHAGGGGVSAVNGAEGVGHTSARGKLLGKCRVIFRFAFFKAGVFQQQNLWGCEGGIVHREQ